MSETVARMGRSGRLVIPARARKALGLEPGDRLFVRVDSDGLHLSTPQQAIRRAQDIVARYVAPDRQLADELIAERREEAISE